MNVTLPNGQTIENVPDGTTKAQLAQKLKANGMDVPNEWLAPAAPSATNAAVAENAANKVPAGLADMVLNAPNNLLNLGKALYGTGATALGRPDLAPDITPNPDLGRRAMEAAGLIKPIVPQGLVQQAIDVGTQGAVGGALTGGATIPRMVAGAGLGALSSGAGEVVRANGGSPAAQAAASLAVPLGAGRALASKGATLSPEQQLLKDEGVSMTPGQIKGGVVQRMEDAGTSVPFLGDAIKGAQKRGIESFDKAAINRALEPIGAKLPDSIPAGQSAIAYARMKLSDAYDNLLPNLKGDLNAVPGAGALPATAGQAAPPSFKQELDTIRTMGQNMPQPQRGQLGRIIDREVVNRFTPQGLASGETLKNIESELNQIAKDFRKSDNYDTRILGNAVEEIQASMRRMIENVNPNYQGELAKINEGYANFKKVQIAAGNIGAKDGVFTPAQLQRAVRAQDTTKDKRAFSEGDALMQDLSGAGKNVLSQTVPDSGTPFRVAAMLALKHPLISTLGWAGALPYSRPGQSVLQSLMLRDGNPAFNDVARRVAPVTAEEQQNGR